MQNIIWQKPDGTYAISSLSPSDQTSASQSTAMLAAGVVPSGWTVLATDVIDLTPYISLSASDQAAAALKAGVILTCTGNSSLNATYSCTQNTKTNILGELVYFNTKGTFFGGSSTATWYDVGGVAHSFTSTQFVEFAEAVGGYIAAVELYNLAGTGSLPSNSVTIA